MYIRMEFGVVKLLTKSVKYLDIITCLLTLMDTDSVISIFKFIRSHYD